MRPSSIRDSSVGADAAVEDDRQLTADVSAADLSNLRPPSLLSVKLTAGRLFSPSDGPALRRSRQ